MRRHGTLPRTGKWLAVVEAVSRRWRGFLEDRPFVIMSDHAALERKLCKSGHDPPVTDRQSRWVEALLPFPFTFSYIKGADNPSGGRPEQMSVDSKYCNAGTFVVDRAGCVNEDGSRAGWRLFAGT